MSAYLQTFQRPSGSSKSLVFVQRFSRLLFGYSPETTNPLSQIVHQPLEGVQLWTRLPPVVAVPHPIFFGSSPLKYTQDIVFKSSMSIQARIHAFESIAKEAPSQAPARKPLIDLYETNQEGHEQTGGEKAVTSTSDGFGDKPNEDEAHNLIVGSIASDFVKVSPPRSKAPPLPPRKTSETTASTPSTPSMDGESIAYSPKSDSQLKSPPTPRPIPSKSRALGPNMGTNGGFNNHPRNGQGHNHAVSSSSFHSVSLSDHGDNENDEQDHELGGSYEAVSPHAGSVFSLVDKNSSMTSSPALSATSLVPPALPPRPATTSPPESHQLPINYAVRKVPPPPSTNSLPRLTQSRSHKRMYII